MKIPLRISCIAIFTAAVGIGCMPMMMMDSGSSHSDAGSLFENITRVGSVQAKVIISPFETRKEATISVELTNAESGKSFENAAVQCFIEHKAQQTHEGHANTEQMSGGDSLHAERHEHWLTMEMTGPGTFGLKYVPEESGSYRIRVRICDVEGAKLAEPVIIETTRQTANHSEQNMGHGMMGGWGDYGIIALVGMATIMAAVMVFRWF